MNRKLIFIDSETCGLHSIMVLLQYAEGKDGDIVLHEIWKRPVGETLDLLEYIADNIVVGFNLSFDWFHIQKIHSIWSMLERDWIPEEHMEEIIEAEMPARDQKCLKAFSAIDLLLHSRRGPYQSLMARKDIRIKAIPLVPVTWNGQMIPLAYAVSSYLESTVELDGIYFARTSDKDAPHWAVQDRVNKDGHTCREFADVVLRFNADGSLKSLAEHALGIPPKAKFADIELDRKHRPQELGYAPFAKAMSSADKNWEVWGLNSDKSKEVLKGYAWPGVVQLHIDHWHENEPARVYAEDDIVYTRGLYYHFDEPEHGDRDSILACMVASVRWHGFEIDIEGIEGLKREAEEIVKGSPINTNKPPAIRQYINEMCDETECCFLEDTTKKSKLEEMEQWTIREDEECLKCLGGLEPDCLRCTDGVTKKGIHPAATRAGEVLGIKIAKKQIELYSKLVTAGRFHASFKVTGTLSNRMAGGDGLNAQGINHDANVRRQFPLVWEGYELCGGDFDGFEVTIADAVYDDLDLRTAIVTGQKLHGLFGTLLYPGYTYEQILDSDHNEHDYEFGNMYGKAKSGVFAMIYGGTADTLNKNLGIPEDVAKAAFDEWGNMFPGIGKSREKINDLFQPLVQPDGLGTAIHWVEPQEYVESFLGFRRYFTLEYKIVRALFELANKLPAEWKKCDANVIRSDRRGVQKAWGALTSALFGASFGIAEGIVRAASNHEIQSPGAEVTKETQVRIWDLQPHGVSEWIVAPMNVHDEVISVTHPDYVEAQGKIVTEVVESYREKIPLIGMSWCLEMENWAEKKGGEGNMLHITYDKEKLTAELAEASAAEEKAEADSISDLMQDLNKELTHQ